MKMIAGSTLLEALVATVIVVTVLSVAVLTLTNLNGSNLQEIKATALMKCEEWLEETIVSQEFYDEHRDLAYGQMTRSVSPSLEEKNLMLIEIVFESPALQFPLVYSAYAHSKATSP